MRNKYQESVLQVFLALIKAGLWEDALVADSQFKNLFLKDVDWRQVNRLAEEQSIVGLLVAGLERLGNHINIPQDLALQLAGVTLQIEKRNSAMNAFIEQLIELLKKKSVSVVLLKGQGVAQCYKRPLWRACGDIDLLLFDDNYDKAKNLLLTMAADVEPEHKELRHIALYLKNGFVLELHGTLRSRLTKRIDNVLDSVQEDVFENAKFREWNNNGKVTLLLNPDTDVFFVFTHILHHFFIEGVGLRQICDWCRLLWTYKETIDTFLLESKLKKSKLMTEWKAFASFAVDYLGMPKDAMPFYIDNKRWHKKAKDIFSLVVETGSFGHNKDMTYYSKYPFLVRKIISLLHHTRDSIRHGLIFPFDSLRIWWRSVEYGISWAVKEIRFQT